MLTTRKVEADGLGEKSELELENKKLTALGLPTTHDQLRDIRLDWEQRANRHLALAGHDIRIDHRSHRDCGLEIEPTQHMGVHATQMDRRGKPVDRAPPGRGRGPPQRQADPRKAGTGFGAHHQRKIRVRPHGRSDARCTAISRTRTTSRRRLPRRWHRPPWWSFARSSGTSPAARLRAGAVFDKRNDRSGAADGRKRRPHGGRAQLRRGRPEGGTGHRSAAPFLAEEQRDAIRHITGPERISAVVGWPGRARAQCWTPRAKPGRRTAIGSMARRWRARRPRAWRNPPASRRGPWQAGNGAGSGATTSSDPRTCS